MRIMCNRVNTNSTEMLNIHTQTHISNKTVIKDNNNTRID